MGDRCIGCGRSFLGIEDIRLDQLCDQCRQGFPRGEDPGSSDSYGDADASGESFEDQVADLGDWEERRAERAAAEAEPEWEDDGEDEDPPESAGMSWNYGCTDDYAYVVLYGGEHVEWDRVEELLRNAGLRCARGRNDPGFIRVGTADGRHASRADVERALGPLDPPREPTGLIEEVDFDVDLD